MTRNERKHTKNVDNSELFHVKQRLRMTVIKINQGRKKARKPHNIEEKPQKFTNQKRIAFHFYRRKGKGARRKRKRNESRDSRSGGAERQCIKYN